MKNKLLLVVLISTTTFINAQTFSEKSINAQLGLGISSPYNSTDQIASQGVFLQGELILKVNSWFELRPYAGLIITNSNGNDLAGNPSLERAESKGALLGGKTRFRAPIPWAAPYLEIGIGASIGSFETFTDFHDIDKSGIITHIPFSLGLELGKENNIDLGLSYYFQPAVKQFAGAFAIGMAFPLDDK